MNLLAIDTSTEIASIALMVGTELLTAEQESPKTHAQFILPMIDALMVNAGLSMQQLDGIIFGCGPGSFTGLRIACSIAKGLAYAHDLDLTPVSSLATIAFAAREISGNENAPVLAVLDARMQEMYWSYLPPQMLISTEHVSAAHEIHLLAHEAVVLAGVGIDSYWDAFSESLKSQICSRVNLYPKAATMIKLAQQADLKPIPVAQAQPVYVRNKVTQGDSRG